MTNMEQKTAGETTPARVDASATVAAALAQLPFVQLLREIKDDSGSNLDFPRFHD